MQPRSAVLRCRYDTRFCFACPKNYQVYWHRMPKPCKMRCYPHAPSRARQHLRADLELSRTVWLHKTP